MPRYFPSKKVFIVGVLAIGLLAWSVVYQNTSQQNSAITNNPLRTVAQAESAFPDSDSDGLYDWEEALYETDPKNRDSDGNGVSDGEQYESINKPLNVRLSDSVYAAVNRLGDEAKSIPNPVDLLTKEPKQYEQPYQTYNLKQRGDTEEDHDAYLVELFSTLSAHAEVLEADPLILAGDWLQTKNPKVLENIKELNKKTMEIAHSLLSVEVPSHFTESHLSLANNLYLSGLSLEDLELTINDPMAGFFAVANYTNYQSKYLETIDALIGFGATSNE